MLAALLLVLAAPAPAPLPDLVMPGFKKVPHEAVLETPEDFKGLRLVALTGFGPVKPEEVVPGVPFRFSSKYRTRLCVVGEDEVLPELVDDAWREAHVGAEPPLRDQGTQPVSSPVMRVRTSLRVASFGPQGLVLEEVRTRTSWDWKVALLMGALVLLGIAGLLWIRRSRSRRTAAA